LQILKILQCRTENTSRLSTLTGSHAALSFLAGVSAENRRDAPAFCKDFPKGDFAELMIVKHAEGAELME